MSPFRPALTARAPATRPLRKPRRTRLWLVSLEDRITPANLIVTAAGDNGGPGQLRAIWNTANSNGVADTITFDPSVTTVTLTSALPAYAESQDLKITGNGKTVTTINAPSGDRIFNLSVLSAQPTIAITDLTLKGGSSSAQGGAIFDDDETLVLTNVRFTQNIAYAGGAVGIPSNVVNSSTILTITGCDFTSNTATHTAAGNFQGGGGAILVRFTNPCTVTLTNSTFNANVSYAGGTSLFISASVKFQCDSCSFTNGNTGGVSSDHGSAIEFTSASTVTIDHSTITGNTSMARAGAIYVYGNNHQFTIQNTTLSSNTSTGFPPSARSTPARAIRSPS